MVKASNADSFTKASIKQASSLKKRLPLAPNDTLNRFCIQHVDCWAVCNINGSGELLPCQVVPHSVATQLRLEGREGMCGRQEYKPSFVTPFVLVHGCMVVSVQLKRPGRGWKWKEGQDQGL